MQNLQCGPIIARYVSVAILEFLSIIVVLSTIVKSISIFHIYSIYIWIGLGRAVLKSTTDLILC